MSLDVYLTIKIDALEIDRSPKIFIRENGGTKEISREEWDARFPDREPVFFIPDKEDDETDGVKVYSANITHNLNRMADAAGIYKALWRPDEIGITNAHQLIPILEKGYAELALYPEKYEQYNPENGWGDYDGLVGFVGGYLKACKKYPSAEVSACR